MHDNKNQSHSFGALKFEELGEHFNKACAWMQEQGCPISATRISMYKKDLDELILNFRTLTSNTLLTEGRLEAILHSMHEASELISVYRGLSSHSCGALAPKLKEMASGPKYGEQENPATSSNRARNTAFELITAARLLAAGYEIDITTEADIIARRNEKILYIECKRPQSPTGVNSNLKGALKQLERRYQESVDPSKVRGIVALSINKAVPPAAQILHAITNLSAGRTLAGAVENFQNEHSRRFRNVEDRKTIGLMFDFSAPIVLRTERMLTIGRHTGYHVLERGPADEHAVIELAHSLREVGFL
jgi:hypothetical protein